MTKRILLAEDEMLVGTMVQLNLTSAGYEVVWVKDGLAAAEQGIAGSFDAILLDIAMPGQDGIEALRQIREAGVETPVAMLSARSNVETKVDTLNLGADDYLPKPFDVSELVARVGALIPPPPLKAAPPKPPLTWSGPKGRWSWSTARPPGGQDARAPSASGQDARAPS